MGRVYAGILGPLAMAVVMFRGALHGAGVEGTVTTATFSLVMFAAVGLVVGTIAESTVDESVRTKLEQQLADQEKAD